MGVLDGKLGDVDAGNSRAADVGGLSPEDAAEFRRMENGGLDNGDNGGVDDPPQDDGQHDEPGFPDRRDPDGGEGDDVDPLDQPLRLPGDRRERLNADDDGEGDGDDQQQTQDDSDLPLLTKNQQTVSAGRFRRETKKLHDKLKAAQQQLVAAQQGGGPALQQALVEKAKLEERLTMVLDAINSSQKQRQQQAQQQEEDDPEPNIDEAPFEHQAWLNRQVKKLAAENKALRDGHQQTVQTQQARDQSAALEQDYVADCQNYAQQDESFAFAYQHLKNSRYVEIADARFGKDITSDDPANRLTDQERAYVVQQFMREEQSIASQALMGRRSPAQTIMRLARARGFDSEGVKKKIAEWRAGGGQQQNGGGKPQPNGQRTNGQQQRSVTEEVRDLQRRRAGSKSLSDGGSAPASGQLTLRQVADMPESEFKNLLNRLDRTEIDEALLGKERA